MKIILYEMIIILYKTVEGKKTTCVELALGGQCIQAPTNKAEGLYPLLSMSV